MASATSSSSITLGSTTSTDATILQSGSNRLSSITTGGVPSRSFQSDAAGNIIQDATVSPASTKAYSYNAAGQLISATVNSSSAGAYAYDFLSRLSTRTVGSTTLHLLHDLDGNVIAEYDSAGALITEHVWLDGRRLAVTADAGSSPTLYYVLTDHLERPLMLADESRTIVWQATYLPIGEVASLSGSATLNDRFPGQWFQLETGLHYNWHRHYDLFIGRYLQPDPIGMPDGPSRFAYVTNSPLMKVDPEGLQMSTMKLPKPPSPLLQCEPLEAPGRRLAKGPPLRQEVSEDMPISVSPMETGCGSPVVEL